MTPINGLYSILAIVFLNLIMDNQVIINYKTNKILKRLKFFNNI